MNNLSILIILLLSFPLLTKGQSQNLVPNGSFEEMLPCMNAVPTFECLEGWGASTLTFDLANTPDLCYEGAVFFPPSSAEAIDGNQYLGIDCQEINPEFAQIPLLNPLEAGVEYCVKFYVSVNDQTEDLPESVGIYFSDGPIDSSPFELDLIPHVQGAVSPDPTQWTQIIGTYTAFGNETHLVVSGYGNTTTFTPAYIYVDQISVIAMTPLFLESQSLCEGAVVLDASAPESTFVWSDGSNNAVLEVSTPGNYTVTRTTGGCAQTASALITSCVEIENPIDTADTISTEEGLEPFPFYVPNAFTPNEDGINDALFVVGPENLFIAFSIYNRWGEILFTADSVATPWNGSVQNGGYYVQDGAYLWQLTTKGNLGETISHSGHLTVLR